MFDFNLDDIFKGYSHEEYTETWVSILIDIIVEKGIITEEELKKYVDQDNFKKRLKDIKDIHKEAIKSKIEELKKGNNDE